MQTGLSPHVGNGHDMVFYPTIVGLLIKSYSGEKWVENYWVFALTVFGAWEDG